MTDIAITRTTQPKQKPADDTLTFGKVFSDHMFMMDYEDGMGWHSPRIVPYGPFAMDPVCCVLHYGQAIFDGLKAFRGRDGKVRLFRLADHARRVNRSADFLCIPEMDQAMIKGGLGAAKTAGNYAASLFGADEAERAGYAQVLWLDGVEHRYLDEAGAMNIMLRIGDEITTPPLNGAILAGVTRDSVLTLLRDWEMKVSERPIAIEEVLAAARAGNLEMWGTGTAAVIAPVGELGYDGERYVIGNGNTGALTQKLYDSIVAIQHGRTNDPYGWTTGVE